MLNKIGYIKSINWEALIEELRPLDKNARLAKYWQGEHSLYGLQNIELAEGLTIGKCDELLVPSNSWGSAESAENQLKLSVSEIKKVQQAEQHNKLFNHSFEIKYLSDRFVAFLYSAHCGVVLPRNCVEVELAKNYDDLSVEQINRLIQGKSEDVPLDTSLAEYNTATRGELSTSLKQQEAALKEAETKAKAELEAFREEMRRQEQILQERQQEMLAELNAKVSSLKDEIFIIENNIFALRSYFGDTFELTQVMKGQNANEDVPLVIYQKFRYMDEDLARLSANSSFIVEQNDILSLFTNYGKDFVNDFCPAERCITFFRASKTGLKYAYCKEENCVAEFEYYHGNQIGMLLRNGGNLWLAFIDEEITLKDNLFLSNAVADSEQTIELKEDEKLSIRDKRLKPGFARKHIFIILDAILRLTNIYPDLKNQSVQNNSKITFSSADGQIETFKYPAFAEFFKNSVPKGLDIKIGDFIFIDEQHAGSEYSRWSGGETHRGVGYRNTVRDASIKKGISRINLIEDYVRSHTRWNDGEEDKKVSVWGEAYASEYKEWDHIEEEHANKYFVSCKRDVWWDYEYKKHNNANVQIYGDEFMSIMWLTSDYVQQWIDAKQVPDKNYTYYVKMMKELRDYLRQKERNDAVLISAYKKFDDTQENRDKLLAWRIQNKVRNMSDFQAKRFAKML